MRRVSAGQGWGIAGLILVVVVLGAAAAFPGRSTVEVGDPIPQDWDERLSAGVALVAAKHASGGFSFLGLQVTGKTHLLDLQFLASAGCDVLITSGSTAESCDGPGGLVGRPIGITPKGDVILNARVEVSSRCHDLIEVADAWPRAADCTFTPAG